MIGGYAYVDAEVTESTTTTIPVGSRLANVPRHSFNLLDTYEFDSGALAGLGLGVGLKYVSERQGQASNSNTAADRPNSARRRALRTSLQRFIHTLTSDHTGRAMNQSNSTHSRKMPNSLKKNR